MISITVPYWNALVRTEKLAALALSRKSCAHLFQDHALNLALFWNSGQVFCEKISLIFQN